MTQTGEKRILLAMRDYCAEQRDGKGRPQQPGALVHDGLHVPKGLASATFLRKMESHVRRNTGYRISLVIKPW